MEPSGRGSRDIPLPHVLAAVVVMLTAAALVVWKVAVAVRVGPGWDTYAFLANAAEFAGRGYGYTEPHRPPFLSLLVAIVFRFVGLREAAIQWVDGALTLSGIGAFYLLLRRRFAVLLSGAGALAVLAVSPLWAYLGVGYTDGAAVALSAWLLLVLIKATEENPAWYLVAGPLFVAAGMTRFTVLLFALPCIVWILLRGSFLRHARYLLGGAGLALLAYMPAAIFYIRRFGDVLFPFIVAFGFSEAVTAPGGEGATSSALYYLSRIPVFLAPEPLAVVTLFVVLVAGVAIVASAARYVGRTSLGGRHLVATAVGISLAIAAQVRGGLVLRQVTIAVAVFAVWRSLAPRDAEGRTTLESALDATMAMWLLSGLDFHGHQSILVPRYFIAVALPLVYGVVRGWDLAASRLDQTAVSLRREGAPSAGVDRAVRIALALFVVGSLAIGVIDTPQTPDRYVRAARDTATWLASRPDVNGSVVYSDLWPWTAWYLRRNVEPMPSFETTPPYAHELAKSDARYYVTIRARRYPDFTVAFRAPAALVLARSSGPDLSLPRVQYLGKSWDHYLEQTTGFRFYLLSDAGRYGWEGSSFLDAQTPEQLELSDTVAVYGVKWRDRATGEAALRRYVENGGSVVLDASSNLGGLAYSVANTVMFDAIVRREMLPRDAKVTLDEAFARNHLLDPVTASPFTDETGGDWSGASYEQLPGTRPLTVIARAGGRPLVAYRDVGAGRVYFLAYNLAWHAFSKKNAGEGALVSAVFDDAIAHARRAKMRP